MDTDCPFGIIPLGSANGMAVELGIDSDPKVALSDFLKSHRYTPLDLIRVNDKHFCLHLGDVGVNARIVENYSKEEGRGMFTYAKHFLTEISNAEILEYEIEADGIKYNLSGPMITIANARKYGTGAVLNYQGNPLDGKFEIVVVTKINTSGLIKTGLSRFNQEFARDNNVETISCKEATIKLKKPKMLQLDGEVIEELDTIEARILAGAVNLVTTGDNPFL